MLILSVKKEIVKYGQIKPVISVLRFESNSRTVVQKALSQSRYRYIHFWLFVVSLFFSQGRWLTFWRMSYYRWWVHFYSTFTLALFSLTIWRRWQGTVQHFFGLRSPDTSTQTSNFKQGKGHCRWNDCTVYGHSKGHCLSCITFLIAAEMATDYT